VNSPASIRARLLNTSRQSGEDFQALLTRYAIERFLFRLGESGQRDTFVLKGAMLFVAWEGSLHRPTKDLDLLGFGLPSVEDVAARIREIAAIQCDDGIDFDTASVETEVMKEDAEYEGVRARFTARLEQARIRMQVDIGFGDAVDAPLGTDRFPAILNGMSPPRLRMYPAESVIAEKVHAMVVLDVRNSRMKDFYDVWHLSRTRSFEMERLTRAFRATFERRRTDLPKGIPFALTPEFLQSKTKTAQWIGFVERLRLENVPDLHQVGMSIRRFVEPVLLEARPARSWPAGGPWHE
jgi:predicted nucleotidyltransferase component of viral defense system